MGRFEIIKLNATWSVTLLCLCVPPLHLSIIFTKLRMHTVLRRSQRRILHFVLSVVTKWGTLGTCAAEATPAPLNLGFHVVLYLMRMSLSWHTASKRRMTDEWWTNLKWSNHGLIPAAVWTNRGRPRKMLSRIRVVPARISNRVPSE
jgi:hypothetical protein